MIICMEINSLTIATDPKCKTQNTFDLEIEQDTNKSN